MGSNGWFLISGITILYVFVIVLIVAFVAICSSCVAYYYYIKRNVGQYVITRSTSMTATTSMKISNGSQAVKEPMDKTPNSMLLSSRIRALDSCWKPTNNDRIETEV